MIKPVVMMVWKVVSREEKRKKPGQEPNSKGKESCPHLNGAT